MFTNDSLMYLEVSDGIAYRHTNIARVANSLQGAELAGEEVGTLYAVVGNEIVRANVVVLVGAFNDDDYAEVTVTATVGHNVESASFLIDGRV